MRKILVAAIFALIPFCAHAQSGAQLGAGQVWGNSTAARAPGKSETVTAILDRALGSTRGSIVERGVSGWAAVGPGATAGLAWISGGTGADPAYGVLGLSGGGCNAALVASNGGILYSTASACAILAGTANASRPLLSGSSAAPSWGAFSLPGSVTTGGVPYFSSTSAMAVLAAGSATQVLHGGASAPSFSAVSLTADVTGTLGVGNGGTGGATASGTLLDNITGFSSVGYIRRTGAGAYSFSLSATGAQYLAGTAANVPVEPNIVYQAEVNLGNTGSGTFTFDFSTFINASITMTGNITTQNLSNVTAGKAGTIAFIQDGTGSRTMVWNSIFKFASGAIPTLTTTANAVDILSYSCRSATNCPASLIKDVR